MKKKSFTDMGPGNTYLGLQEACEEVDEDTEDANDICQAEMHAKLRDTVTSSLNQRSLGYSTTNVNQTLDEETTTVFDLVHRGRQRQ